MCSSCGNEFTKWVGQCPACGQWNTLQEVSSLLPKKRARKTTTAAVLYTPKEAIKSVQKQTVLTGIGELDRVLGPGLTAGGVYLLAGQPGIGKSTLLTQLALSMSKDTTSNVLYVCSEETPPQVAHRIGRLSSKNDQTEHINLLGTSDLGSILSTLTKLPTVVIVDSIQSIATETVDSQPGTMAQIRACTNLLIETAKSLAIPVILVGHVTKQGSIAGPKLLEHMVDVVLQLEGDRRHDLRLLRGTKNRFGPTDETGIFQMTSNGLVILDDPTSLFLSTQEKPVPGSALSILMEGTRPLTCEIQALTIPTQMPIPRRVAQGITTARLQLICAIVTKHCLINLGNTDVYVNVTGGLTIREPAADLAIALAIVSSARNLPLPKSVCMGELGLLGEIRPIPYLDRRLKQAKQMGYKVFFTPQTHTRIQEIRLTKGSL